ncbi:hypothetical protein ACI2VD_01550 [Ralstonia nicotianae]|nr:hypothetical protein HI812_05980 [Ralstonia solanacearum]QKL66048.1 hypothetical protein HI808_05980 [Ralstonia solanacearum]
MFDGLKHTATYRYIPEDPPSRLEELTAWYKGLGSRRSPGGKEAWLNWALIDVDRKAHGYVQQFATQVCDIQPVDAKAA